MFEPLCVGGACARTVFPRDPIRLGAVSAFTPRFLDRDSTQVKVKFVLGSKLCRLLQRNDHIAAHLHFKKTSIIRTLVLIRKVRVGCECVILDFK